MEDFNGVDARDGNKVEGGCPCPDPFLASVLFLDTVYCWRFGGTYVDDDGDAVGQREIRAEFPFYDVEILFMRIGPSTECAYHRLWCLVGLQRWPSGPAV
jgi:hypothetical protein